MGRYYSGDIEGKFWFGVQSSAAADRFGSQGYDPSYIQYCFDKEDLPLVVAELAVILDTIGTENMQKLDAFFDSTNFYNNKILAEAGMLDIWNTHKSDYADYQLGIKIRNYLLEHDSCEFEAEL